jgi:hypothetical protein
MPSFNHDPKRLPTRREAAQLAGRVRAYAAHAPDADEGDYLIAALLDAFAREQVKAFDPPSSTPATPATAPPTR